MLQRISMLAVALLLVYGGAARGEDPLIEPRNGPRRIDPGWHALTGAVVHSKPGEEQVLTVVLRAGRIVSVSDRPPPAGARIWDLEGHHIYAGFIDAYVEVEVPAPGRGAAGSHWNPMVTPHRRALDGAGVDTETAKVLRNLGFTAAAASPKGGILRGTAALVSLAERSAEPGDRTPTVFRDGVYQAMGFDRVQREDGGYPDSQMGAIAVMRQTLIDADWQHRRDVTGTALDGLRIGASPPLLFDVRDELEALRAAKVAREFGRPAILVGSGTEFRRLEAIRRTGLPVILPLSYPRLPQVASVGDAEAVGLRKLMTWEQAPTNPRRLAAAGITTALTTSKAKKRKKFPDRLRRALKHGLTEQDALAMLTTAPARILRVSDEMGTIRAGKIANLQVTDGPVFKKGTRLRWLFIEGTPREMKAARLDGRWTLSSPTLPAGDWVLEIEGDDEAHLVLGDKSSGAKNVSVVGNRLTFTVKHDGLGDGVFTFTGLRSGDGIAGHGTRPDTTRFRWTAKLAGPLEKKEKKPEDNFAAPESYGLPFGPYATNGIPEQPGAVIVRGATIWTCGPAGVVKDGVLVIAAGKVVYAGSAGKVAEGAIAGVGPDPVVIEASGRHVTPGLIDAHSHTGISKGINEAGQAVTAEVRIQDVTNPDDINFYRQLAGGLTTANQLHGSANPIGGQNCVVKLRWGVMTPDEMHLAGAAPGIKFALGENVKQSNWGDKHTTRYPQTRMGVETLMRDRFTAAREYAKAWEAWDGNGDEPRRDLELEALAEILAGERLIHCHSYRQDEILMLCRIAGDFGFRIGTFQHVLEGYKVAEAIKEHAIGASCFSDWWAYKVEVQDAIPYNGAIMREAGVLVTFNSDSGDLARRMNTEAAKAVKYGGVPPEEALKFVTINAAKQLRIDDRIGSLETGKDADFVIWSGDPLSTLTRCESTWIDGREYWSIAKDAEHRKRIAAERRRLIQKVLLTKKRPEGSKKEEETEEEYSCCHGHEGGGR